MAKKTVTNHGKATRDAILEAAIAVVCEKGFAGTPIREVCERVGIAKTALYWHFGSKAGLMGAVVRHVTGDWIDEMQTRASTGSTPMERQDRLMESFRSIIDERPHVLRILILTIMESGTVDEEIREAVRELTDQTIEAIARGFNEGLGLELPDADLIGHTAVALLHAALRRKLMEPDCDMDRLFRDMRRTLNLITMDRIRRLSKAQKKAKKKTTSS